MYIFNREYLFICLYFSERFDYFCAMKKKKSKVNDSLRIYFNIQSGIWQFSGHMFLSTCACIVCINVNCRMIMFLFFFFYRLVVLFFIFFFFWFISDAKVFIFYYLFSLRHSLLNANYNGRHQVTLGALFFPWTLTILSSPSVINVCSHQIVVIYVRKG